MDILEVQCSVANSCEKTKNISLSLKFKYEHI